jgi:hypothetical protein
MHVKIRILLVTAGMLAALLGSAVAEPPRPARDEPTTRPNRPGPTSRPSDDDRDRRPPPKVSPERIRELMARMKTENADLYARLAEMRENSPGVFQRTMGRLDQYVRQLDALPAELQEVYRRQHADNVRVAELVKQIGETPDPQAKAALTTELRTVVARQFDNGQKIKEHRLQTLAAQLEALKVELQQRAEKRDEIIDGRITDLLGGKADQW